MTQVRKYFRDPGKHTTFSLTSLSAHTEQKEHRVSSEAGDKQQQDTKKRKTFTITPLLQGSALSGFKDATSARSRLPQDQTSSFYGFYLLTTVPKVCDLPNTCQVPLLLLLFTKVITQGKGLIAELQRGHKHRSLGVYTRTDKHAPSNEVNLMLRKLSR